MSNLYDNVDDYNDGDGIDQNLNFSGNTDNFDNSGGDQWGNINNKLYSNNQPPAPGSPTGLSWSVNRQPRVLSFASVSGIWAHGDSTARRYSTDGLGTILQSFDTSGQSITATGSISEYGNPPASPYENIAIRAGTNSTSLTLWDKGAETFVGNYTLGLTNTKGSEYKDGNLYTVSLDGNVRRYAGTGQTANLTFSVTGEMTATNAYGLAKVSDGYVIADRINKTFFKYDDTGNYTGISASYSATVLGNNFGICSDLDGFIYAGDTTNDIIYQFHSL